MLESFPIALTVGTLMGYLAGLGIGGGSLLIMWLTLVIGMEHPAARAINLMFFICAAGAVSFFRWKKGSLDLSRILPAILSGCAGAAVFSWISLRIDVENLRKFFGILLLITGVKELFYRPRKLR